MYSNICLIICVCIYLCLCVQDSNLLQCSFWNSAPKYFIGWCREDMREASNCAYCISPSCPWAGSSYVSSPQVSSALGIIPGCSLWQVPDNPDCRLSFLTAHIFLSIHLSWPSHRQLQAPSHNAEQWDEWASIGSFECFNGNSWILQKRLYKGFPQGLKSHNLS